MHDEPAEGLFIGVGVDRYTSSDLPDLRGSADEVQAIAKLVGDHFTTCVLRDPDEATVHRELRDHAEHFSDSAGSAIVMWSGHGIPGAGPNTLKLLAHDSRHDPSEGFDAVEVATRAAATGANQILLIIDTCYAGNAVDAVVQIYNHFRVSPPAGEWCWFGLLAACGPEKVRQHQLGPQLERLLQEGPRPDGPHAEDIRRRWSTHQRFIRGDDLWDALIKHWDHAAADTEPKFTSTGDARPFIRNPLWVEAADPLSVDEVLTGVTTITAFFGRQAAVLKVSGWLAEHSHGVYVVTGAQGSGKSALLRETLSRPNDNGSPTDRAEAVIVDVGGLSAEVIAATIDRILVARGVLDQAVLPRNAFELCGRLQRLQNGNAPVPVIALDALSEAADPARVVESLITPLSTVATVMVTTRPAAIIVPRQRRASQPPQWAAAGETADLVPMAAVLAPPDRILDLDSPQQRKSGWDAIEEMLKDLPHTVPDDDPAEAIRAMRLRGGDEAPPPFVLAKLLLEEARPPTTKREPTRAAIDNELDAALDQLVANAYDDSTLAAATALLSALPFGFGAGLPEREWLTIANSIRPPQTPHLERVDLAATLAPIAAYIIEDSESGEAVYRFAHTFIAQHFAARARSATDNEHTLHLQIAAALVANLETAGSRTTSRTSPHLQRYLWRYVARAGEDGLDLLRGNDSLSEALAGAALAVSIETLKRGDVNAALPIAEEAASVAERLTGPEHDQKSAPALAHLATILQTTGQIGSAVHVSRRAVAAYNELVSQQPLFAIDLAAAALNLANILMDAQDTTASGVARQAVELEKRFMREGIDSRYRLGVALNTLALALSMEGRIDDAVQASRDSVEILEAAVDMTATERDRAAFAQALQNLGSHLAERGEVDDAVALTERALATMNSLVASDDTWRPALLETLSDLGVRYIQAGQTELALTTSAQAVEGYQEMTEQTPAEAMNYAGALTNYASILTALGRSEAAMEPASIAVAILRDIADREEAKRPALALMLDNYANALNQTGRHSEALEASEQALEYYRAARDKNPSLDNDVARVLSNHCQRLAAAGRFTEAAAGGTEAIALYEQLSVRDPRSEIHAATTRSVVAMYLVAAGNANAGMLLAAQATLQGEQLLAKGLMPQEQLATIYIEATKAAQPNPALASRYGQRAIQLLRESGLTRSPEYATALRNLAALHGMAGHIEPGLETIAEAVTVWTQLLAIDSSHRNGVASALGTQARLQLERRRPYEARDTAIAAVEHYRLLPEMSRDDVDTCGRTFATLAIALKQCGDNFDRLDELLAQCLRILDGPTRALLIYNVVSGVPPEHPQTPSWIHTAISELGNGNLMLVLYIRRLTRKIRDDNRIRFDQLWQRSTDTDVPVWAFTDQQRIDWAMRWISSDDFTTADAFLQQNAQLLGDDYNGAVDEALLVVDPARAAALKDIRDRLRFNRQASAEARDPSHQPDARDTQEHDAAQPNIYDLAEQFLEANLSQRLSLLAEHGELLRDATVGQHLRARTNSPRASAAVSLIEVSRIPLHIEVAAVAADADQADTLLSSIADQHDTKVLQQAAVVLMNHAAEASEPEVLVAASFYVGVSLLESELSAQMRELIGSAAEAAPTRVAEWHRLCERLAPAKPEFAQAAEILEGHVGDDG